MMSFEGGYNTGPVALRIRTAETLRTLNNVSVFCSLLDDLFEYSMVLARLQGEGVRDDQEYTLQKLVSQAREAQRPAVRRLRMDSPLTVELVALGPAVGSGLLALRWVILHAEDVGAAVPRMIKGWRREWGEAEALQQRVDYFRQVAGDQVEVDRVEP
jgi:hypothetical protein